MREIATLFLSLIWASGSVAHECPAFSDREWEFVGHLVTQTYPGPPNYESISGGDEPVTRWYLQLPSAICFTNYDHQYLFQISLKPEDFERYRQLLGREIRVQGTLEEGVAGYHRTALILKVSNVAQLGVDRS